MDCPICFDEINASTGSTVLSCRHTFHLTCIVKWYSTSSSCPCCRGAPSQKETILEDTMLDKEKADARISMLEHAQEILLTEKNRLEKIAVKHLSPNNKKWYQFSKYLERFHPNAFGLIYADDGFGNEVVFNTFIEDRIQYAEVYARSNLYNDIYVKFLAIRIENKRLHANGVSCYYKPSEIVKSISIEALKMIEVYQDIIHLVAEEAKTRTN